MQIQNFKTYFHTGLLMAILVHSWPGFTWILALLGVTAWAVFMCKMESNPPFERMEK